MVPSPQVRRIAAAPHSREEAEAEAEAAMHAVPQDSVRSISLTGLRDPLATEGLRVSAADLAAHRASRLSVSSSAASPPQQPRTPFADSDGPAAGLFESAAEVSHHVRQAVTSRRATCTRCRCE